MGALTESNIAIISNQAEKVGVRVNFLILGVNDFGLADFEAEVRDRGHDIEARRVRLLNLKYIKDLRDCDLILDIGAGDSFSDIYGFGRFFFYWLSKVLARVTGTPVVLCPQTIGPFDGLAARLMAVFAMKRCDWVFTRDELSTAYLKSLGMENGWSEAVDVAFKLPFKPAFESGQGERSRVGINVSGLLYNGGYTGGNQFGLSVDYRELVDRLVRHFASDDSVELHLIGHVIEPNMLVEDDFRVCANIASMYPNVVLAPSFKRAGEAKGYISGMDFFTGARMHACIGAFSSGVAVVPMAYSRKFNGLFGTLDYKYIADLKALTTDQAFEVIVNGFASRGALKAAVFDGNDLAKKKIGAYEDFLCQWFMRRIRAEA